MRETSARERRLRLAVVLASGAAVGLSIGTAWANPDPPEEPAPANETPAPPSPEAPAPSQPSGEPFIPPGEGTPTPANPVEPAAPPVDASTPAVEPPTPIATDTPTVASSSDSSPSPASRAGGAGVVAVGAGAAAAGGLFRRRPHETDDEHKRRVLGGVAWGAAGTVILVVKGITIASVGIGGGCILIGLGILWWGAPGRVRQAAAPVGPPVDLQQHLDAARDHNVELNASGVRTQTQQTANPVDDP